MPVSVKELCRQIRKQAEADGRPSKEIFAEIMQTGAQMYFSKQWPKDGIISFCAAIVRFCANETPEKP